MPKTRKFRAGVVDVVSTWEGMVAMSQFGDGRSRYASEVRRG